jgi:alpha-glucosidase
LDYIYTAFHGASVDGTPVLRPLFFNYPKDPATYTSDLQFFYGKSLLVAPVTDEDSTSITFYLPEDTFYNFHTGARVPGAGNRVTLNNVAFTSIPLFIKGGAVLPLRVAGAMTTTLLRQTDFEFVVAPGANGKASGELYIDDGESVAPRPEATTQVTMDFAGRKLKVQGSFGYATGVKVARVRFLGVARRPARASVNGNRVDASAIGYDGRNKVLSVAVDLPFTGGFSVEYTP